MIKKEELLNEIRNNIEKKCLEKKLSFTELSKLLNKNERYVSNKFSKNSTVTVNFIYELADKLECEPTELFPSIKKIK